MVVSPMPSSINRSSAHIPPVLLHSPPAPASSGSGKGEGKHWQQTHSCLVGMSQELAIVIEHWVTLLKNNVATSDASPTNSTEESSAQANIQTKGHNASPLSSCALWTVVGRDPHIFLSLSELLRGTAASAATGGAHGESAGGSSQSQSSAAGYPWHRAGSVYVPHIVPCDGVVLETARMFFFQRRNTPGRRKGFVG